MGEFLEDFIQLPTQFYQPGAPEAFSDFIEQWGTHLVKSVKLGGKFQMIKTTEENDAIDVDEFRQTTQKKFEALTASSAAHITQNQESFERSGEASTAALFASFSISGSTKQDEVKSQTEQDDEYKANATINQIAAASINQNKLKESFESTFITTEGGDSQIAAAVANLYSQNFRYALADWLKSIDQYPKAFNMVFTPLTKFFERLSEHLLDDECRSQCFAEDKWSTPFGIQGQVGTEEIRIRVTEQIGKNVEETITSRTENTAIVNNQVDNIGDRGFTSPLYDADGGTDFCVKDTKEHLLCADSNVRSMQECTDICVAGFAYCELDRPKRTSCLKLVLEEERWLRRVSALETAIDMYQTRGIYHNIILIQLLKSTFRLSA